MKRGHAVVTLKCRRSVFPVNTNGNRSLYLLAAKLFSFPAIINQSHNEKQTVSDEHNNLLGTLPSPTARGIVVLLRLLLDKNGLRRWAMMEVHIVNTVDLIRLKKGGLTLECSIDHQEEHHNLGEGRHSHLVEGEDNIDLEEEEGKSSY
jgi:hypothetical protein